MQAAQSSILTGRHLLALLRWDQEVDNRYGMDRAVTMCVTGDADALYADRDAPRAARAYDMGAGNAVEFPYLTVDGDRAPGALVVSDPLCRIAGVSGPRPPAG